MKQVFVEKGKVVVREVPRPKIKEGEMLVKNVYSLISTGTESGTIKASQELFLKKENQTETPLQKVSQGGMRATLEQVKASLKERQPLGYSTAGVVIKKGKDIKDIDVGDRVACMSGYACHAELIHVPRNLAAKIPEGVSFKEAAFTTLGAIAMHGIRVARLTFGENVVVMGLGLLGQLSVQILRAAGCYVMGISVRESHIDLAKRLGMELGLSFKDKNIQEKIMEFTNGYGADAVIICSSAETNEIVRLAMEISRDKGKLVVVGVVGMDLPRKHFFSKELEFLISRTTGPGRYHSQYEEEGKDYPIGFVRWTENRNMQEFLRMVATKKINLRALIEHIFPLKSAPQAYKKIMETNPLATLFRY